MIGHRKVTPYLFTFPAVLMVCVVLAYPVLYGVYQSLFRAEIFGGPENYVGLQNYTEMLHDPDFWHALKVTSIFVGGCIVVNLVLGLLFAFALNRVASRLRFLRAVTIGPYIVSNVAAAVMFRILFNSDAGLLNDTIEFFGLNGPHWLSNPHLAMIVVIFAQVWTDLPLTILLLLGGLQAVDGAYHEAALVDGASGWKRAWHISIPMIAPQLLITTVWESYQTLTGIGVVLALTGGGPLDATRTLAVDMYRTAFDDLKMDQGLAIGTFIIALNAVLTLLYYGISRRYGQVD